MLRKSGNIYIAIFTQSKRKTISSSHLAIYDPISATMKFFNALALCTLAAATPVPLVR